MNWTMSVLHNIIGFLQDIIWSRLLKVISPHTGPCEQCCTAPCEQCCAAPCGQCCVAPCEQCCVAPCGQCCTAPCEQCCQKDCSAMITMLSKRLFSHDNNVVTALFKHQYCYNLLTRLSNNESNNEQAFSINIAFFCFNNREQPLLLH